MNDWEKAQEWEKNWHGDCCNTWQEEMKQTVYAKKMGIDYNCQNQTVLDIGGGEVSLLLKCSNLKQGYVIDPLMKKFPEWVRDRYRSKGIITASYKGEDIENHPLVDEVWIYNVLQHTENPQKIIKNAIKISKIIRLFEWIEEPVSEGHIHNLTEKDLNYWLNGTGKTEQLNESGCYGLSYYGVFLGLYYAKV